MTESVFNQGNTTFLQSQFARRPIGAGFGQIIYSLNFRLKG